MDSRVFWDTHGFFALLSSDDVAHQQATELLRQVAKKAQLSVTSDWIIGETCTLLTVRRKKYLALSFLEMIIGSKAIEVVHISDELFDAARQLFIKRRDKQYSFTDCTSFALMRSLGLKKAATEDGHFVEEGFQALLAA